MKKTAFFKTVLLRLLALLTALCLLPVFSLAEDTAQDDPWIRFLLLCNEGMTNDGGNVGNTMMVVAMNMQTGTIRLMMFTWDTFIDYEGYDVPQKIDMPYRNNGPQEVVKVFNHNFDLGIDLYLSLNYSNLAALLDDYGGVDVEVTRAERNALNSMVASKKDAVLAKTDAGFLNQLLVEMLASEYYLDEFGPDTHLNGLQAVGFGWLQYDSVYNCCEREGKVISQLFSKVADKIGERVVFYNNETGVPADTRGRRAINVEAMTDKDLAYLLDLVNPIFRMSCNNLDEEHIRAITTAIAQNAYRALRQGVNIFDPIETAIFPLEAKQEYDLIAGTRGHVIDPEANIAAMRDFLFAED